MSALSELYGYLLPCFFIAAFLHSSVGLAGGSSYTAFMAIFGVPLSLIPSISLSLNTLVSSIGTGNFVRQQHFKWSLWWPFQLGALPLVYVGARTELPALVFYAILWLTLALSVLRMVFSPRIVLPFQLSQYRTVISLVVGAVLGFLSGSIGIGGGIYLLPCILMLGFGTLKQAAAVAVVFILVNSVVGLATKWQLGMVNVQMLWPALLTVGVGGALGSWLGAKHWSDALLRKSLLLVLIIACVLLARKIILLLM